MEGEEDNEGVGERRGRRGGEWGAVEGVYGYDSSVLWNGHWGELLEAVVAPFGAKAEHLRAAGVEKMLLLRFFERARAVDTAREATFEILNFCIRHILPPEPKLYIQLCAFKEAIQRGRTMTEMSPRETA